MSRVTTMAPIGVGSGATSTRGGSGLGRGLCTSQEIFWNIDIQTVSFCAFCVVLYTANKPVLFAKNGAFGLPKVKLSTRDWVA